MKLEESKFGICTTYIGGEIGYPKDAVQRQWVIDRSDLCGRVPRTTHVATLDDWTTDPCINTMVLIQGSMIGRSKSTTVGGVVSWQSSARYSRPTAQTFHSAPRKQNRPVQM